MFFAAQNLCAAFGLGELHDVFDLVHFWIVSFLSLILWMFIVAVTESRHARKTPQTRRDISAWKMRACLMRQGQPSMISEPLRPDEFDPNSFK